MKKVIALVCFLPSLLLSSIHIFECKPQTFIEKERRFNRITMRPIVWCIATLFIKGDKSKVCW